MSCLSPLLRVIGSRLLVLHIAPVCRLLRQRLMHLLRLLGVVLLRLLSGSGVHLLRRRRHGLMCRIDLRRLLLDSVGLVGCLLLRVLRRRLHLLVLSRHRSGSGRCRSDSDGRAGRTLAGRSGGRAGRAVQTCATVAVEHDTHDDERDDMENTVLCISTRGKAFKAAKSQDLGKTYNSMAPIAAAPASAPTQPLGYPYV